MTDAEPLASAEGDTREAIMDATYRALCEHGFADLTTQDIADESELSKAALHYHYDTKAELLLAFLDHLYEGFTDAHAEVAGENAVERLVTFVDGILHEDDPENARAFHTALLEIRAQAPYDEAYREKLVQFDAFVRERVESIVADGIDEGTVRADVDPADTAAFVATLVDGVNTRRVSVGDLGCGSRRTFLRYVREHLVAPDADVTLDDDTGDTDDTGGTGGTDATGGGDDDTGGTGDTVPTDETGASTDDAADREVET